MMYLGMTETEEFLETISKCAECYEVEFSDLVTNHLDKSAQIELLTMVFANNAEESLGWWENVAAELNKSTTEEISAMKHV